ncbi:MAG TPA: histidinol-phosphate transaminase [Streptosporangiaceae bacterium]|jgi:histidinol-phosphate aminotransferase|nr:histidinol-phosphate transaminase [Streptosporangiaceae bacterium]
MGGISEALRRVAHIPAYQPGRASPGPAAGKLSSNEAPLGPAPSVRQAIAAAGGQASRYPEQADSHELIAEHLGVPTSQLLLTNGSDELCYLIASVFLGPGSIAVLGEPCYQIDAAVSLLAGAALRRVPLAAGAHDLAEMAKAARDAAVVWLPSPHNPTGVTVDASELQGFLEEVPPDCLVVLDEAYRAYADPALRPDSLALLRRYPNLLIQRTLSKDWALAGLRVGYAIAAERLVSALARTRAPFSVNSVALAAVRAALREAAWHDMSVARVREERSRLEAELARLGIEHFPSQANFVTARIEHAAIAPALRAAGLTVRDGDDLGIPGGVRISVGWAPQMAVLRGVLRQLSSAE